MLHLSALNLAKQLHVWLIEYEEPRPLPLDHPFTMQAFEKGYRWTTNGSNESPKLSKPVTDWVVLANS